MPAKSKAQQKAAGAALSAKRGETSPGSLQSASKEMFDSMSERELEELAETDRKGLPEHTDDGRKSGGGKSGKSGGKSGGGKD